MRTRGIQGHESFMSHCIHLSSSLPSPGRQVNKSYRLVGFQCVLTGELTTPSKRTSQLLHADLLLPQLPEWSRVHLEPSLSCLLPYPQSLQRKAGWQSSSVLPASHVARPRAFYFTAPIRSMGNGTSIILKAPP